MSKINNPFLVYGYVFPDCQAYTNAFYRIVKKYGLKGSSSINVALKILLNKEYVFKSDEGYCVYDRFME